MRHVYDNPNTCYVIGDAVAVIMGTAATNRQPASGVEEQISSLVKSSTTDAVWTYDGTNNLSLLDTSEKTNLDMANSIQIAAQPYNMSIMINNSVYLRKNGTTDRIYVGGVQTNE